MHRTREKQTIQDFIADTLPVARILRGRVPSDNLDSPSTSQTTLPVAVFDTSKRPDIRFQDLARLLYTEGESETEFAWDICETRHDLLLRLTCAYQTPIRGKFALLFRYNQHREFLRWVLEHGNAVPIADTQWDEQLASEHPILLCPRDEEFADRLRLMRMHHMSATRNLTVQEIGKILFEVKRVISYGELATFAKEVLKIPVEGADSEHFPNAFQGPEASLQLQQISREFHVLLLHIMLLGDMTAGYAHGTVFFFTEDWLAEHQDETNLI